MTKQEAYERVRAYLTRPGARRAFDPTPVEGHPQGTCRYETVLDGETHHCAVGCLLEPEDLARSMGSFIGSTCNLFREYGVPQYLQEVVEDHGNWVGCHFLNRLQDAHDQEENWSDAGFNVAELDKVARNWHLTVPE